MLRTKFQPNISCFSGKKVDFIYKARVDVNVARVGVNFQTVTMTLFRYRLISLYITKHQVPTFQPFWRKC